MLALGTYVNSLHLLLSLSAQTLYYSATFGDYKSLTYVQAMVLEMMRWRPTTSYGNFSPSDATHNTDGIEQGSDHVVEIDDEYKGYHIPAGTAILTNLRSALNI